MAVKTKLQRDLSEGESKLLLLMERLPPHQHVSSNTLARELKGNDYLTPANRAKVLYHLARLEQRGLIARGPANGWVGSTMTELGRMRALVERVMPAIRLPRKPHIKGPPLQAMYEARTVFPKRVIHEMLHQQVLKPGHYNGKVGGDVLKGHFRGYKIYTLTLEERATCPRSCAQWGACYGNSMSFARRYKAGPELEDKLRKEVPELLRQHPNGVLIRLHVLGDFYSAEYVRMWGALLQQYPKLAVFGYTARNDHIMGHIQLVIDVIGWRRFAIRYSTQQPAGTRCATVYEHGTPVPSVAFACPEQLGKVLTCGHCAACWEGEKSVAFLRH